MKRLYLASSIDRTGVDIGKDIGRDPKKLKLAFISTAAEIEEGEKKWLKDDKQGLERAGFNLFEYTITGKTPERIKEDFKDVDIIHVNGGNEYFLMQEVIKSGFDRFVNKWVDSGKIYIGSSAGSIIMGPDMGPTYTKEDIERAPELKNLKGLGIVDFVILPHWGQNHFKDFYLQYRMKHNYKPKNKLILLNDWQFVKVEGNMYKIVDVRD